MKSICLSHHWIQPPTNFEVNICQKVDIGQKANLGQIVWNPQFSSDWLEIWRGFIFHVTEFKQPIIFEVNMDENINIGQRSTTKVVFLKSSIFIRFPRNLKGSYISGHWIKPTNYFWGQHQPKGPYRPQFLKLSIFIRFTWNLKKSCMFGCWIEPPIMFFRSNLFYGFCKYRALHDVVFL